jgi:hypothetical protein
MDGKDLTRRLRQMLNEDSDSNWLDSRTTYDFLYEAAIAFVDRTHCLKSKQTITTIADQTDYNINGNFLKLYLKDTNGNLIIKIENDFIPWKDHSDIVYGNQTDSVSLPDSFTVIDANLPSQITGTATSASGSVGGKSTLTDTTADFTTVSIGDSVHNTTDGSTGIIIGKTSTTVVDTAMFGGSSDDWASSDSYVIQPQGRYKLILDPPPDGAKTITLFYVQNPDPVYYDYGIYRIPNQFMTALIKYAFWLYKYRDKDPNFGDGMYKYWDAAVRKAGDSFNQSLNRKMKIRFK